MFRPLWGGTANSRRHSRLRAIGAGLAVAGPGGVARRLRRRSSSDANEKAGTYEVKVVNADVPDRAAPRPDLAAADRRPQHRQEDGAGASRSRSRSPARKARPPRSPSGSATPSRNSRSPTGRSGSWPKAIPRPRRLRPNPAAPTTSNRKTFDFGPLKPGTTVEAVWKLSAVKAGKFTLLYGVDAGLSGTAKAKTAGGVAPGGSFVVGSQRRRPNTEVTDSGEVVEIGKQGKKGDGK